MQTETVQTNPKRSSAEQDAIEAGARAELEIQTLTSEIERMEADQREAHARKRSANSVQEHASARDSADWLATRIDDARTRLQTRHAELSPDLQARTIVEARERVLAAKSAYKAFFERLGQHSAAVEKHLLGLLETFELVRTETDAQRRLATLANAKIGKMPIDERAPAPTHEESFAYINSRVRQILNGGLQFNFPQQ
jgi:hypothetical protein